MPKGYDLSAGFASRAKQNRNGARQGLSSVPQVLLAVYPKCVLPLIEQRIHEGRRDPRSLLAPQPPQGVLLDDVVAPRVRYIEEAQLREVDPQLRSFMNINTPEEFSTA